MSKKRIKILAIDDKPENIFLLKELIADTLQGAVFLSALSGSVGIELCRSHMPDVVLLDLTMPDMNGYEVCKIMKTDEKIRHIPIIMITAAMVDSEMRVQALDSGADAFLSKPIDISEFKAQIRAMLRIKDSEDHKRLEHHLLESEVKKRTRALNKELSERRQAELKLKATYNNLKKNQKINESLMLELKAEVKERLQAEIKVLHHLEEQKIISEFSSKLVSLNQLEEAYQYIGQKVFENLNNAYVVVTQFNYHARSIGVKWVYGMEKYRKKISNLFGFDPFKKELLIADINYKPEELAVFRSQKFFEPGGGHNGLHFLFAYLLDKDLCNEVQKLLGVAKIYTMGFTFGKKLYGGLSILLKEDVPLPQIKLFETLISETSVVLQRLFVEEKLKLSEKLYRTLVITSPDGIMMTDLDGLPVAINKKCYEVFGYEEGDVNFSRESIFTFISPVDRERCRSNFVKRIKGESMLNQEYVAINKDGSEFPIDVNSSAIMDETDEPYALISVIRDISQRKQAENLLIESEEKYRLLAHNMIDILSVFDRSGKITYVNNSVFRHLGYKPAKVIGMSFTDFLYGEDLTRVRQLLKQNLALYPSQPNLVHRIRKKNKGDIWFDTNILFLKDNLGRLTGFQCVSRNISEKIESENRLETERKKVMSALIDGQELERQRLSMELHDGLGQRLAGIKIKLENSAYLSLEDTRQAITSIKSEFRDVIDEIRFMSMNVSPTILTDLGLVTSLSILGKQFRENSRIDLEYTVMGDFDNFSEKKAFSMYRIVQEGLNNIAKHAHATEAKLALIENEGNSLIVIEDNGTGFNKEMINRNKGNGLSNMRQRTLLLNGTISIESGINSGTVIMVKIPK
ncbi:MAG TPA: PAS domain S-box protein [Bacteroidales bacterium]|nr:PAS domain S-box protein [Bacteroidales bacterium]HPS26703.1 PAS domain S-box protein [Bacteroidales bacterium]